MMVCPEAQLVLAEHLKHGMFYEVFSYDCVKKDKDAVMKLCKADNYDSAFALGETELQLLRDVHASLTVARPPVGKTQWDVIKETTATSCGQRWSDEYLNAIYNFAKVVGDIHVAFLTDNVAVHVPWDTMAVRPSDFHLAARIGGSLPWLKVALLTAQYFPPEGRVVEGPFQKSYGNLISKSDFERIAKASGATLKKVEGFLAYLACIYLKSPDLPRERLAVEIPAAFARTARAVLLARDFDVDDAVGIEKVEIKLRQKLAPGELPPPFHQGADEPQGAASKKPRTASAIEADTLPPLTFDGGQVVEDAAALARAKNLQVGCRVVAVRAVRGVCKGGQGSLLSLGKEALVRWDAGALVDCVGEGVHDRGIPLASLQTAKETVPVPVAGGEAAQGVVHLPAGEPWTKFTAEMGAHSAKEATLSALYGVFASRSAGPDQVMIDKDGLGRALSLANVAPRGLIVLPYVREMCLAKATARKAGAGPDVWIKVGDVETRFIVEPSTAVDSLGEQPAVGAGEGESLRFLDLFWKIYKAEKSGDAGGLALSHAEVSIPVACYQIKEPAVRAGRAKAGGNITAWVPFLTNPEELRRGDALWCHKG